VRADVVLNVQGLEAAYGASQVLFGVDFKVMRGELCTLLGRNGMGKSTAIRAVVGLTPAKKGTVSLCGRRIEGMRADQIARRGVALVPEGRQIFPNLSVRENLLAFAREGTSHAWTMERVLNMFPALKRTLARMGNRLSGGEQQMLAIGRALMTNPQLLILDEATEGLAPLIREEVWRCLSTLKADGLSVLVVDKYVERLLPLADRHTIFERGQVVWQGDSTQLASDRQLWHRYLGV